MDSRTKPQKGRSIWLVPFSALAIVLIIAVVDLLFTSYFLKVNHQVWMWAFSSLITFVVASLVTEFISLSNKRALFSLALAGLVSMVIYLNIAIFLHEKAVGFIESIVPNPVLSNALYVVIMTLIPGVTIGGLVGAVISLFPMGRRGERGGEETEAIGRIGGVEKYCERCGYTYPFDSSYCPFCGIPLSKRSVPLTRFCRYCGSRIYTMGKYCPECGRDIRLASRPEIYISK